MANGVASSEPYQVGQRRPGHAGSSTSLLELTLHLYALPKTLGKTEDLDEAIVLGHEFLSLCTPGHSDDFNRGLYFITIAANRSTGYVKLGGLKDLDVALTLLRETRELRLPGLHHRTAVLFSWQIISPINATSSERRRPLIRPLFSPERHLCPPHTTPLTEAPPRKILFLSFCSIQAAPCKGGPRQGHCPRQRGFGASSLPSRPPLQLVFSNDTNSSGQ